MTITSVSGRTDGGMCDRKPSGAKRSRGLRASEGYVYPGAFVDELCVGQVVADVEIPVSAIGDVGGTSLEVVTSLCASHGFVQGWTAVAAGDDDGLAGKGAEGFEDFCAEATEIGNERLWYAIVDAKTGGSGTSGEFRKAEMWGQIYVFHIIKMMSDITRITTIANENR